MKKFTLLVLFLLTSSLFQSCKNTVDYSNTSFYDLKVGDELNLYFTTNSCCFKCVANQSRLKYLSLKNEYFVLDTEQEKCEGCNRTKAFKFVANSAGIDTIRINSFKANDVCNDSTTNAEEYIIRIQ